LSDVERLVGAVKHETFERDAIAFTDEKRFSADELERRCARGADDARAGA
jgi:hypothetical protein